MNAQEQMIDCDLLVRQAQAGDAAAFNRLVTQYFGMAYSVALARVRERETAEDLAQEVFLRAFLNIQGLRVPAQFPAWIACITRNLACNWLRDRQNRSRLVPVNAMDNLPEEHADPTIPSPREQAADRQQEDLLRGAVHELPESLREVVLLHYGEGLSRSDIARLLGVHPSSIGRLLDRALKALRCAIETDLRQSVQPLRAAPAAALKATAALGVVALLPAAGKAAMASATADTLALGSSAATGGWAGSALVNLTVLVKTGGAFMATGKGIATGAAVIALMAGAVGYQHFAGDGASSPIAEISVADRRFAPIARGIREHEASIKTARAKVHSWSFDARDKILRYLDTNFVYKPGHSRMSFKDTYRPDDAASTITIEEGQREYAHGAILTFHPDGGGGQATIEKDHKVSFAGSYSAGQYFAGVSTLGNPISTEFYKTRLFTNPTTRFVGDEMLDGRRCHHLKMNEHSVWICPEQQYSILRSEIGQNTTSIVEMQYISPPGIWFPRRALNGLKTVNELATVTGEDGSVAQTVLNEHREDGCDFSDVELNVALSDDDFEIKLPPGTFIQSAITEKAFHTDTTTTLREILAGKIKERVMTQNKGSQNINRGAGPSTPSISKQIRR
jgi:RNA polymerase sigma-70 factor (ECF subfamily)